MGHAPAPSPAPEDPAAEAAAAQPLAVTRPRRAEIKPPETYVPGEPTFPAPRAPTHHV